MPSPVSSYSSYESGPIDLLQWELERLFSLEELRTMSERFLGLDPEAVGGSGAKGSFARALTERCADQDQLEALVDVLVHARREVDPRVRDLLGGLTTTESDYPIAPKSAVFRFNGGSAKATRGDVSGARRRPRVHAEGASSGSGRATDVPCIA